MRESGKFAEISTLFFCFSPACALFSSDFHVGILRLPENGVQAAGTSYVYYSGVYIESTTLTTSNFGPASSGSNSGTPVTTGNPNNSGTTGNPNNSGSLTTGAANSGNPVTGASTNSGPIVIISTTGAPDLDSASAVTQPVIAVMLAVLFAVLIL